MTTANLQDTAPHNAISSAKAAFFIFALLLVCQLFKYTMLYFASEKIPEFEYPFVLVVHVLLMSLYTALFFFSMFYYNIAKQKKTLKHTLNIRKFLVFIPIFLILPFILENLLFHSFYLLYLSLHPPLYVLTGLDKILTTSFFAWDMLLRMLIKCVLLATLSYYVYRMLERKNFTQATSSNLSIIRWATTGFAFLVFVTILVAQIFFQIEHTYHSNPVVFSAKFKTMIEQANLIAAAYAFIVAIVFAVPFYLLLSKKRTCIRPWRTLVIITMAYGLYLLLTNTVASMNSETYLILTRAHIIPIVVTVSAILMGVVCALFLNITTTQQNNEHIT